MHNRHSLPLKDVESSHYHHGCNIQCNPDYFVYSWCLKHTNIKVWLTFWKRPLQKAPKQKLKQVFQAVTQTEREVRHKLMYVQLYVLLTMVQSGCSMSFRMLQELVVTELTPAHHIRENSQRSLTTHTFTVTFLLVSSLWDANTEFE